MLKRMMRALRAPRARLPAPDRSVTPRPWRYYHANWKRNTGQALRVI